MENWWEYQNGLNPFDPDDADLDADNDGLTNLQEYEQGTDPNAPNPAYQVILRLDWGGNADLDAYAKNEDTEDVCYYSSLESGGFTLNQDAHPECDFDPFPPEVISGIFTESGRFSFW
jgi:hypothetical protein